MSEVKTAANAAAADANASAEEAHEVDSQAQEAGTHSEVNDRLLKESKAFKSRALSAERELERIQKASLEEQGKFKEMYEATQQKYESLMKNLVKEKIKSSVSDHASKVGCVNVEALLKLGNPSLLEFDEEQGTVHGSDLFVEEARKQHPYLFNSAKTAAINSASPGGPLKEKKLTAAEIAKLPADQKAKLWASMWK